MSSITVYMFHAIGEVVGNDWADPEYCLSKDLFKYFLYKSGRVSSLGSAINGEAQSPYVLTFDDGHLSNYWAGKYIYEHGYGSADFFINPEHIGKENYMTWPQVCELSRLGMGIQSHGLDHKYLSDLSDADLKNQLSKSKTMIEQHIHSQVRYLSPPGGRYDKRCLFFAKEMGYQSILNSAPGVVINRSNAIMPRIAIKKDSDIDELLRMTHRCNSSLLKLRARYQFLKLMKLILGNQLYEKIRWYLLGVKI